MYEKVIEKGLSTFDDAVYARGEAEADRTARHLADMKSDNPLSKMIRPIMSLAILFVWIVLHISIMFLEKDIDTTSVNAALISVLGFYFVSRSYEKVNSRKAAADIHINKKLQRQEIKERKREMKNK